MKHMLNTKPHTVFTYLRSGFLRLESRPVFFLMCCAMAMNFLVESLSRHSPLEALRFLVTMPHMFLLGCAIILATMSVSLLFPRRRFVLLAVSAVWLALGVGNCVVLTYRALPVGAIDFLLIDCALEILFIYMNGVEVTLIFGAALLAVLGLILAWRACRRERVRFLRGFAVFTGLMVSVFCVGSLTTESEAVSARIDEDITEAYADYGFAYCFAASLVDRGVEPPEDYSEALVQDALEELPADDAWAATPNIIFLQLESFLPGSAFANASFSQDPTPVFTALMESCPSGRLIVPTIGAGTVNTEFEVLTGMNLDHFGVGEYPYKTFLQTGTCVSLCRELAELDYTSHAIHNHYANFYDRSTVYPKLGFDSFTSLEYLRNVTFTPLTWAEDAALLPAVTDALASTAGRDFIYTVSVQGHGKYPAEHILTDPAVTVSGTADDKANAKYEYLVNQLRGTDAFLGALLEALESCGEPVVLVAFGDHVPNLNMTGADLTSGDLYATEYVIWSNFGLDCAGGELRAYQLGAHVLQALDIEGGPITALHQTCAGDMDYQEKLQLLQYDLLYGQREALDGTAPAESGMRFGTRDITITSARYTRSGVLLQGENFTQWSIVLVNGQRCETWLLRDGSLYADTDRPEGAAEITVAQSGSDGKLLSETAAWVLEAP